MAELIKSNSSKKCDLKFHAIAPQYNRIETFKYKKTFFEVYIDKNDSVYDIRNSKILSWKTVEVNGKNTRVPDEVDSSRNTYLFNKIKGNPSKIAYTKIMAELDASELLSLIYFNLNYF